MGAHAVVLELLQIPYEKVGFLYGWHRASRHVDGLLIPPLNLLEPSTFILHAKRLF